MSEDGSYQEQCEFCYTEPMSVFNYESNADLSGGEAVRSDALLAALRSYLCQYTVDEDGNGLTLIDMLSPGETIADGELEIRLLADFISGMLQPKAS